MGKHIHEGEITFNNKIRCKICSEDIDSCEDIISTELSGTKAHRILNELASAGEYTTIKSSSSSEFPLYSKNANGIVIEITARRVEGTREYEVIKRVYYNQLVNKEVDSINAKVK